MKATIYHVPAYKAVGRDGEHQSVRAAVGLDAGDLSPEEAERLLAALRAFARELGLTVREGRG